MSLTRTAQKKTMRAQTHKCKYTCELLHENAFTLKSNERTNGRMATMERKSNSNSENHTRKHKRAENSMIHRGKSNIHCVECSFLPGLLLDWLSYGFIALFVFLSGVFAIAIATFSINMVLLHQNFAENTPILFLIHENCFNLFDPVQRRSLSSVKKMRKSERFHANTTVDLAQNQRLVCVRWRTAHQMRQIHPFIDYLLAFNVHFELFVAV